MSRSDRTMPYLIQIADLNGIRVNDTKLVDYDSVIQYDFREHFWRAASFPNRGRRKKLQREFTTKRRQRDRRACHQAMHDPEGFDVLPVIGDRRSVNWYLD